MSLSYAYKLTEVRGALEAFLRKNKRDIDTVFWLDIFSVGASTLPSSFWSTAYKTLIRDIDEVLLILSPFDNPIPFKRAWCAYETYAALALGCRFSIILMTEQDVAGLKEKSLFNPQFIHGLVSSIDIRNCGAPHPADVDLILTALENYEGGVEKVNEELRRFIQEKFIEYYNALDQDATVENTSAIFESDLTPAAPERATSERSAAGDDAPLTIETSNIGEDDPLVGASLIGLGDPLVGGSHLSPPPKPSSDAEEGRSV